ncbi:DNA primase [Candidatus Amesbacteria bacterium]|nr:DNA primase [Candidatus Amesbacteria bacterium]
MIDQVQEIKQKIDIVELIQEHMQLKKAGRNYKGLCPFHGEKTPSFMVNPELQIFKCFGCQVGGDAFTFLQKIEGMDFYESLQTLAKRAGVELISYRPTGQEELRERLIRINTMASEYYHYLLTKHDLGKKALDYLHNRKITDESIEKFKLGFAPEGWDYLYKFLTQKKKFEISELERVGLITKTYDRFRNRIIFPLLSARGQTLGFAGRLMPESTDKAGKYVNTSETEIYHKSEMLYGLDITRSEIKLSGLAVVVEGEIDCMASFQAGIKNVVAIKGSALTDRQAEILKRICDTVVLALDADIAGDAAARRGVEIAEKAGLNIKIVVLKDAKDPGDFAADYPEGWKKAVAGAIPIYDFYLNSAVSRYSLEASGKKKIGQELLPIWAQIQDEIVRAHYIKLLSKTLDVDEADVRGQMSKVKSQSSKIEVQTEKTEIKENILEAYLVELALKGNKLDELPELADPFWSKVSEQLKKIKITELPAELKTRTEELMLHETEYTDKEWEKTLSRWEEQNLKRQLHQETDTQKIKNLSNQLSDLTKGRE